MASSSDGISLSHRPVVTGQDRMIYTEFFSLLSSVALPKSFDSIYPGIFCVLIFSSGLASAVLIGGALSFQAILKGDQSEGQSLNPFCILNNLRIKSSVLLMPCSSVPGTILNALTCSKSK
uniref:Uncharacterized protein n=1 Tax=Saimiri boliviensis boliviensis TaxID=39432 RepID=A0A2K6UT84_SAIBB